MFKKTTKGSENNREVSAFKSLSLAAALIGGLTLNSTVIANDFDELNNLTQAEFESISENIAAATVYKAIAPAEPLGLTGIDLSIGLSRTDIDDDLFEISSSGDWDLSGLTLIRGAVQKGLPFGFDIGGSVATIPDTDLFIFGAEIRYALIKGGIATPAVALRAAYSIVEGVDELDFNSKSIDLSISKGFLTFTPYAGIGQIFSESEAVEVAGLDAVDVEDTRVFAGINVNMGMNIGLEVDSMSGQETYSAKIGLRF